MPTNYPGALDTTTNLPSSPDPFAVGAANHTFHHPTLHAAVRAIEAKLGIGTETASAANTNDVLMKLSDGTTAWQSQSGVSRSATRVVAASNAVASWNYDYLCDGTNDEVQIQQAIDDIAAAGWIRGRVVLTEGRFNTAARIKLKSGISIWGQGVYATEVRATGNDGLENPCIFALNDVNVHATEVAFMRVYGNYSTGGVNGFWYDNTGGTFSGDPDTSPDPAHYFHHLFIRGTLFDGIKLRASAANGGAFSNVREVKCTDVYVLDPQRDGFDLACSDSSFVGCTVASANRYGWNVDSANNRFTTCKAYFSDQEDWIIDADRTQLVGCQSQDAGGHGFWILGNNNTLAGCQSDSPGTEKATTSRAAGVAIDGDRNCVVGHSSFQRTGGGSIPNSMDYGYQFISGTHNIVTGTSETAFVGTFTGTPDLTTQVIIVSPQGNLVQWAVDPRINSQTGTTYTLVAQDAHRPVELSNAGAITLTVPPNSSVAFPIGTVIEVVQMGAGQVTIAQGSGVTIRRPSTLVLRTQYSTATLRKRATDEWVLAGDTT